MSFKPLKSRAFTLVELLVVVSIIGMLSSVVLAAVGSARDKGRVGAAIKFATHNYHAFGANAALIYLFNESSGTTADTSGNSYNGTVGSSIIRTATSYNSTSAFTFAGGGTVNDLVTRNNFKFAATSGITISVWIKMASANSAGSIVQGSGSVLYNLYIYNGRVYFYDDLNAGEDMVISNAVINDGKWHNVTMMVTTSGANVFARVYIDGKLDNQGGSYSSSSFDFSNSYNSVHTLQIGGGSITSPTYLVATLDDLIMYNDPLTLSQIRNIYLAGLPTHTLAQK